jgi:hypothetical protein
MAFIMGAHERVGADSPVELVDQSVARAIASHVIARKEIDVINDDLLQVTVNIRQPWLRFDKTLTLGRSAEMHPIRGASARRRLAAAPSFPAKQPLSNVPVEDLTVVVTEVSDTQPMSRYCTIPAAIVEAASKIRVSLASVSFQSEDDTWVGDAIPLESPQS